MSILLNLYAFIVFCTVVLFIVDWALATDKISPVIVNYFNPGHLTPAGFMLMAYVALVCSFFSDKPKVLLDLYESAVGTSFVSLVLVEVIVLVYNALNKIRTRNLEKKR